MTKTQRQRNRCGANNINHTHHYIALCSFAFFFGHFRPTCIWKYGGGGGHMMECVIDRQHQMLATTLYQCIIITISITNAITIMNTTIMNTTIIIIIKVVIV